MKIVINGEVACCFLNNEQVFSFNTQTKVLTTCNTTVYCKDSANLRLLAAFLKRCHKYERGYLKSIQYEYN